MMERLMVAVVIARQIPLHQGTIENGSDQETGSRAGRDQNKLKDE